MPVIRKTLQCIVYNYYLIVFVLLALLLPEAREHVAVGVELLDCHGNKYISIINIFQHNQFLI